MGRPSFVYELTAGASNVFPQSYAAFATDILEDLLEMEGMDKDLAYELAGRGVVTMEDLAEQATDDLLEIEGMDEKRAAELIMTARAPWFEEAEES